MFTHRAPEEQQPPTQHSPSLQQKSGRVLQDTWLGLGLVVQTTTELGVMVAMAEVAKTIVRTAT